MNCERSLVGPTQIARRPLTRPGHMHRWLAGAACVCAFSLPFTVAWMRDGSAESQTALTATTSHVMTSGVTRLPGHPGDRSADVEHAASMMLVGTLLVGIGSMVRRGLS